MTFLSRALAALLSSRADHLCNFGTGHYEEHFYEIILNLDQWFRRCCLEVFPIKSSGATFVQPSRTICAILVRGV